MSEPIAVGPLLDALGVEHHPEDGELVECAVVLLKVIDAEGSVSLRSLCSDGVSWIERIGLLQAALTVELPSVYEIPGE